MTFDRGKRKSTWASVGDVNMMTELLTRLRFLILRVKPIEFEQELLFHVEQFGLGTTNLSDNLQ